MGVERVDRADARGVFCAFDDGSGTLAGSVSSCRWTSLAWMAHHRSTSSVSVLSTRVSSSSTRYGSERHTASWTVSSTRSHSRECWPCQRRDGQLFVGVARSASELALDYAKERVQGGEPIFEHESVRGRLFRMLTETEAARAWRPPCRLTTSNLGAGAAVLDATKVFCTQTAFDVATP